MKILGLDTETTGLNPQTDSITEVGLVLFDTEVRVPVRVSGFLVKGGFISEEITRVTGLTNELTAEYGYTQQLACKAIAHMALGADYFCAHNAPFDRGFVSEMFRKEKMESPLKPWIDTRTDLPPEAYKKGKSASLKYLCCDHAIYYHAHRAVNDVLAMLELLSRYDLDTICERAATPNVEVRAVVSFDDKQLAKERSYYWKPELKQWRKPMKANEVEREKNEAPFPVILIEGE
jgi:DNA polymerase-3 subunit epsilon